MSRSVASVLFVTPECAPLVKTGGLGDVAGSLPAALTRGSADVKILLPGYRSVLRSINPGRELVRFAADGQFPECRLLDGGTIQGVPLLLLDCRALFDRDGGPYQDFQGRDWHDNAMRFGLFCRIAADICNGQPSLEWRPQLAHCNDWQTGLVPAYLRFGPGSDTRTLFTIHNLAYQGLFPGSAVADLGLPAESYIIQGLEYHGQLSFLKAGLFYADAITTVSPTYAREIQRPALGMGLEGLLAERSGVLTGILNGIDTNTWNPAQDERLPRRYDSTSLALKHDNKLALQRRFGLETGRNIPLFATVCRLAHQKGIDLILDIAGSLLTLPAQLLVCGTGDHATEEALRALAGRYPGRVGTFIGFDEELAHLTEAGADAFLMPSRFEPCGMNQMYSQRYGTPPIVHATGGLADSVTDTTPENLRAGTAAGFVFSPGTREALKIALHRVADAFHDPQVWRAIQTAGMRRDFSWTASAARYIDIYRELRLLPAGSTSARD